MWNSLEEETGQWWMSGMHMLCIMCITRAKTDMTGGEDTVYGASKLQLQLQECNLWLMYQSFGSLKFS
jgi:hypothetical protein